MNAISVHMEADVAYAVVQVSHRSYSLAFLTVMLILTFARYLGRILLRRMYTLREGPRRMSKDCQPGSIENRYVLRAEEEYAVPERIA